MAHDLSNIADRKVILGLSGGVDSAVAALLLLDAGAVVEALHMTNWEDEDGYCTAAEDLQDARRTCDQLGIPLHHVNFAKQYRDRVFEYFLDEYRAGRTPNPDVLCNREIKFGVFREYAKRLGGELLATGHYARTATIDGVPALLKGADSGKDQSYFLHAVSADALAETVFPLGDLQKADVRRIAKERGLVVHDKKDSTGICFIGERNFKEFLSQYIDGSPGDIRTMDGQVLGQHDGLMFHTLGQRQGLGIGGVRGFPDNPWYVLHKDLGSNDLYVGQDHDHPWLLSQRLRAEQLSWVSGCAPENGSRLTAKVRYRQQDQACTVSAVDNDKLELVFDQPQRAVTPGQSVVLYDGESCLGGGIIDWADTPSAVAEEQPNIVGASLARD